MSRKTFSCIVVIGLVAAVACTPDLGSPLTNLSPGASDWYGDITAVTTFAYGRTTHPSANIVQTEDHSEVVTIHAKVSKEGVRTQTIKGTLHDYDTNDITAECLRQYSTSLTEGTAPETVLGSAVAGIPGLPPGFAGLGLAAGYFSLRVDEAGTYAYVDGTPLPSLTGTVTIETETTNHVFFETCEGAHSDSSENPSMGPIGAGTPLDRIKGSVTKDGKGAAGDTTWRDGDMVYLLKWSLKKAKDLEADVGGPYNVERGEVVNLDASRSRGDIERYVWTMTPRGSDCQDNSTEVGLEVGQRAEHEGKTFSFTALCNVDLKLVVHGKNGAEDTDNSGEVNVRARTWRTDYKEPDRVTVNDNGLVGGKNQCAYEPIGESQGHYLHRDDDGFEVRQVGDPDGPFAKAFYLANPKLKVKRRESEDAAYIGPNGTVFVGTGAPFNALLQAQIAKHESAHTQLVAAALKRNKGKRDPAQRIEKMATTDETRLRAAADVSLSKSNRELCMATQHPYVFAMLTEYAGKTGTVKDSSGNVIAVVPNLQMLAQDDVTCPD
jgi:hypothetical protein